MELGFHFIGLVSRWDPCADQRMSSQETSAPRPQMPSNLLHTQPAGWLVLACVCVRARARTCGPGGEMREWWAQCVQFHPLGLPLTSGTGGQQTFYDIVYTPVTEGLFYSPVWYVCWYVFFFFLRRCSFGSNSQLMSCNSNCSSSSIALGPNKCQAVCSMLEIQRWIRPICSQVAYSSDNSKIIR